MINEQVVSYIYGYFLGDTIFLTNFIINLLVRR